MNYPKVFIHGLESSSQGTKALYLRRRYPEMIVEDFSGTLKEKMERLTALLAGKSGLVLTGSSYGGLMAVLFALDHPDQVARLILLAPALTLPEFDPPVEAKLEIPVIIYHGENDELIPGPLLKAVAERHFLNLKFHLVADDHSLHRTFRLLDWDRLLDPETGG